MKGSWSQSSGRAGILILVLFMLPACALQADLVDVQTELERLREEQTRIRQELGERPSVQESPGVPENTMGDLVVRLDQLTSDLQAIRGQVEQNQHRMTQLIQSVEEQERRIQAVDRRFADLERRLALASGMQTPGQDRERDAGTGQPPQPDERVVLPGRPPLSTLSPMEVYNLAYNDYLKGNYDLSIVGFQTFLRQFPNSTLAPHAAYWLGESYYSKKDYLKAIESFDRVIQDFAKSEKVAGALLKKGLAYLELGDRIRAQIALKRVVEEHPFSSEANLAKNKLAELN